MRQDRQILKYHEAVKCQELYALMDSRGRRIHTVSELAEMYQIGETTMYRVVNRKGPYKNMPEPLSNEELEQEAAESAARFVEMMKEGAPGTNKADQLMAELSPEAAERLKGLQGEGK